MSRHGVPAKVFSDRGCSLGVRKLLQIYLLLVNATAYHPQTDGLVERFKQMLISGEDGGVEKEGKTSTNVCHSCYLPADRSSEVLIIANFPAWN